MPTVIGQDVTAAEQTLLAVGLDVSIQIQETCDVPTNTVMDQLPGRGFEVASGMTVVIVVAVEPLEGCAD
jgi:beta-lactam-binding protein with PASTA domain